MLDIPPSRSNTGLPVLRFTEAATWTVEARPVDRARGRNGQTAGVSEKTGLVRLGWGHALILFPKISDQSACHLVELRLVGDRQIIAYLHKASKRSGLD